MIPVHKMEKDKCKPDSYKPISLTSCAGNLTERIWKRLPYSGSNNTQNTTKTACINCLEKTRWWSCSWEEVTGDSTTAYTPNYMWEAMAFTSLKQHPFPATLSYLSRPDKTTKEKQLNLLVNLWCEEEYKTGNDFPQPRKHAILYSSFFHTFIK